MTQATMKERLQQGETIQNAWLTIPSAWTAELLAHAGYDALTIDMQHGLIGYETALSMLQAISSTDAVPFIRLSWNDPSTIMKMLDAGAQGVICPMINTRNQAEAFAGACRFPPHGYRSCGPIRAELYSDGDYVAGSDRHILAFAMIETVEAMENLEEIMATPGLDGVYVGPMDLSISMGIPRRGDLTHPDMVAAFEKVVRVANQHGRIPGIPAYNAEKAIQLARKGFRFITPIKDSATLKTGSVQVLEQMRAATGSAA